MAPMGKLLLVNQVLKGMTTYAQKWKGAEIYKRKSAWGLQAKKKNMIVSHHHPKENIVVV